MQHLERGIEALHFCGCLLLSGGALATLWMRRQDTGCEASFACSRGRDDDRFLYQFSHRHSILLSHVG